MKYMYFIGFQWTNKNGSYGFGNCCIESSNKYSTPEIIMEVQEHICVENKKDTVVILNFQLLSEEEL